MVLANFCEVECLSQESGGKLEYWSKWHFSGEISSLFRNLEGMRKKKKHLVTNNHFLILLRFGFEASDYTRGRGLRNNLEGPIFLETKIFGLEASDYTRGRG